MAFQKNPYRHLLLRCLLQSYLLKQTGGHANLSLKIPTVVLNGDRLWEEKHRKRDGEREKNIPHVSR